MAKKNNSGKKSVPDDLNIDSRDFQGVANIIARRVINYPVDFPVRTSMDVIARYLDDELYSKLARLEADRLKVIESRLDPSPWEIEIAYYRRETGIRKVRREVHEEFLRNNASILPEEEFYFDDDFVLGLDQVAT
jgi:hypothetical protein